MDLMAGLESVGTNIGSFFQPILTAIAPPSIVSTQILIQPNSNTFFKGATGSSVLSTDSKAPVNNFFGTITELAGKVFGVGSTPTKTESSPRTATTPVKSATIDLASIFGLAKDALSLGSNIFGTTNNPATPAAATTKALTAPAPNPLINYYPSGTIAPTQSSVTSIFTSTKTDTTNTAGNNNFLWWIIIILAILMIVAMTRKG